MNKHNYLPRTGKIVTKTQLTEDTVAFKIKLPGQPFNFSPGQFVMLSVLGFGEVPIGISSSPTDTRQIEVAVRKMGTVTEKICTLGGGDEIGVSGPFGHGFPISRIRGKDVVLVAGGLGLPPLRSFVKLIEDNPKLVKSLTIMNGAKTPTDLLYHDEYPAWEKFAKVHSTVDSCGTDWQGCVGLLPTLFDQNEVKRGAVMIVCGPPVMFQPVIDRYAGKRVAESDLYFLLERRMHCGIGKCQHCTCGGKYVCLDGPVFAYSDIKYNPEAFK